MTTFGSQPPTANCAFGPQAGLPEFVQNDLGYDQGQQQQQPVMYPPPQQQPQQQPMMMYQAGPPPPQQQQQQFYQQQQPQPQQQLQQQQPPQRVVAAARCVRDGCPCDSFDNAASGPSFCSKQCRAGKGGGRNGACAHRVHLFHGPVGGNQQQQQQPYQAAATSIKCARAGCPCDSWNNQHGEFCSHACKNGAACARRVHVFTAPQLLQQQKTGGCCSCIVQ